MSGATLVEARVQGHTVVLAFVTGQLLSRNPGDLITAEIVAVDEAKAGDV